MYEKNQQIRNDYTYLHIVHEGKEIGVTLWMECV